ncbi:MAG: hypothetical protein ACI9WU_002830, partial [Myxococcota bacterium]
MIQRIVLIKLEDAFATPEHRAEVAAHTRAVFPTIPQVKAVTVGTPADQKAVDSWDLTICVQMDSVDAYHQYAVHPIHRAYVDDYLKPKLACLKAWNF